MTKHNSPRPESAAHKAMCRLIDLGGTANTPQLMRVLGAEFHSTTRFNTQVINQVIAYSLATVIDGVFTATLKGKNMVAAHHGHPLPVAEKYVGQIAGPRMVQKSTAWRPLSTANIYAQVRPDGLTFKSEPSLMGGQRVLGGEVVE